MKWTKADSELVSEVRFTPLLITLLIYIFGLLPMVGPGPLRNLMVGIVSSVMLSFGVLAVSNSRISFVRSALVVVSLIVLDWWRYFHQSERLAVATMMVTGLAILAGILLVVGQVLRARRVTSQTIQGAICGYLLLVMWWSFLYFLIGLLNETSFQGLSNGPNSSSIDYLYFSFVTMTTLGFGDISPISEGARSLVMLQAVVGQFYLAILMARLVAIQIRDSADP